MNDHRDDSDTDSAMSVTPLQIEHAQSPGVVQFIGVISANPQLRHTSVPREHQSNPLVRNQFFYTVPEQLLQSVCRPQVGESFKTDDNLLEMELALSRISDDHGTQVGFWNNMPIVCNLMHSTPIRREDLERIGHLNDKQIRDTLRAANERLASFSEICCGYAGWLMTNEDFLTELEGLTARFGQQMHHWGTAMVGIPVPSNHPANMLNPSDEEGWPEYSSAILDFCVRWRLQGLAGPRIPIPMRPMMSGQFPLSIVEQLMRAGGVFNWPDTFPLYARDELRDMLADALRSSGTAEHLLGWRSIIDAQNKAKNQIQGFERRFRLKHFWRLLRERHPDVFPGRLNRIESAFAEYFGVDDSTIRLDRTKLRKSLGRDWDRPGDTDSRVDDAM